MSSASLSIQPGAVPANALPVIHDWAKIHEVDGYPHTIVLRGWIAQHDDTEREAALWHDLHEWLKTNLGAVEDGRWVVKPTYPITKHETVCIASFRDQADAVVFRLRWPPA
jgi:hypothetical protein